MDLCCNKTPFSASCQSASFNPKQALLLDIGTRATCINASLAHSTDLYLVSPTCFLYKFYGGPLCIQLVTSNSKMEETNTMQIFAYFDCLFYYFKNLEMLF